MIFRLNEKMSRIFPFLVDNFIHLLLLFVYDITLILFIFGICHFMNPLTWFVHCVYPV